MARSKTFELLAPDGGYGYVILFAVVINLCILNSLTNCFGIMFNDFFIELDMGSADITFLCGVCGMCSSIGGFLTAPLLKILSKRQIGLLAASLFNCGLFCTAFAQSKIVFFIFQGLVQGLGFGFFFNISTSIINDYFVEKQFFAISLAQTLSAALSLLVPQLLKWSIEVFGHRSTLIWSCAMTFQSFVGVALFQPVARHMKKVEISHKENEIKLLLQEKIEASPKTKRGDTTDNNGCKESITNGVKKTGTRYNVIAFIKSLVDLELLRTYPLSVHCLAPTLCVAFEMTFVLMLPQALQSNDWNEAEIAWAFSLLGFGDLIMRILLIFLNKWLQKLGSRELYLIGIILAVVTRIGILVSDNKTVILSFITLMGLARCIILVIVILVVSESASPEKYTAALGIFMMTSGIMTLTLGPVFGIVRDYTGSYTITFSILTGIFAIVGMVWAVYIIVNRCKKCSIRDELENNYKL